MNRLTVEEFKEAEKLPLIVVLDDVRSLYNVGSVFRSCDAFRVEAVYLCGITATPPNAEIHKTALGGEDSVDWEYFKTTEEAVEKLKQKGFFIYSIEQVEGSKVIDLMPDQLGKEKGGTMRLGAYPCKVREGTLLHRIYGEDLISERHRHRYEFNNDYRDLLESKGLVISGRGQVFRPRPQVLRQRCRC